MPYASSISCPRDVSADLAPIGGHRARWFTSVAAYIASVAMLVACAGDGPVAPVPPSTAQTPAPTPPPRPMLGTVQVQLGDVPSGTVPTIVLRSGTFERIVRSSRTVDSLPAGTYEVLAEPIVTPDTVFDADPARQVISISASQVAPRISIRFRPRGALLVLQATGLPAYARGTVRISGPDGFARTALTGDTLVGLRPGEYSLTADQLETTDGRFEAIPSAHALSLSMTSREVVTFAYGVARAALTISVDGLPRGSAANVAVAGPAGFSRTIDSTTTIHGVAAGLYTARAERVRVGGFSYDPDVTTRDAAISGTQQRALGFAWTLASGAIAIGVNGLPQGATPRFHVTSLDGFTRTVDGVQTLIDLAPGRYRVTADPVSAGALTYTPTPAERDLEVGASLVAVPAVFTFGRETAALALDVIGLPAGLDAAIQLTSPSGTVQLLTGSTALDSLAPGIWRLDVRSVATADVSYDPEVTSRTLSLPARETTNAVVRYLPRNGSLAVSITGLPAGAASDVLVTGPSGFSRTLAGPAVFDAITTGTYRITASRVVASDAGYDPTPAERDVSVGTGQRRTETIAYALATGALAVNVTGLANGVNAAITVSGPNGFTRSLTASTTLTQLAPGSYTVTAAPISTSGGTLAPSPSSRSVTVSASLTPASAAVAYGAPPGAMRVAMHGLPAAVSGAVTLEGPGGVSITRSQSGIVTGLAAGAWLVRGNSVTYGSERYAGAPVSQNTQVLPADTVDATITFSRITARLTVTIAGLPSGTPANVTVTGPNDYIRTLGSTQTLLGLEPGTYTISAPYVSASGSTYTPSSASQTATVTAGATVARTVTYALSGGGDGESGPNLAVESAYVTQAIQNVAGAAKLVAGREALLRVFVRAAAPNTISPMVRVRLYEGGTNFRTFTISAPGASVPTAVSEGTLASSWNATLSPSDMRPNLRIQVDVDPTNAVLEPDETDNVWPRSGTQALDVADVSPFNVVFVPVRQSVNGLTGDVTTANLDSRYLAMVRQVFPLRQINASVRAVYTTNAPVLQSSDGNGAWLTVLSEMNMLRNSEVPSSNYFGVVNVSYGGGIAGYGYVPGRAAVGWDKSSSSLRVTAHELGHNFGRRHVAACGSGNTDNNYPYTSGQIGGWGWNPSTGAIVSNTTTDIMGYCSNQWVSDYTWNAVFAYRASLPAVMAAFGAVKQSTLLVWGRIVDGVVTLEPAVRQVGHPVLPARAGRYRVELRDELERVLTGFAFEPESVDHAANAQTFTFAIPLDSYTETRLASVAVTGGANGPAVTAPSLAMMAALSTGGSGAALVRADDGASTVTDPAVRLTSAGGASRVTWDDRSWPGAIVRDAATGQVLAWLRRSGDTFVPHGATATITFSNGLRSYSRTLPAR